MWKRPTRTMLSITCAVLVAVATPPVLNTGPNAGLMAIAIVSVTLPRSTKIFKRLTSHRQVSSPHPRPESNPLGGRETHRASQEWTRLQDAGKTVWLASLQREVFSTVPHARPPVRYHSKFSLVRMARARVVPKFVSFLVHANNEPNISSAAEK